MYFYNLVDLLVGVCGGTPGTAVSAENIALAGFVWGADFVVASVSIITILLFWPLLQTHIRLITAAQVNSV